MKKLYIDKKGREWKRQLSRGSLSRWLAYGHMFVLGAVGFFWTRPEDGLGMLLFWTLWATIWGFAWTQQRIGSRWMRTSHMPIWRKVKRK